MGSEHDAVVPSLRPVDLEVTEDQLEDIYGYLYVRFGVAFDFKEKGYGHYTWCPRRQTILVTSTRVPADQAQFAFHEISHFYVATPKERKWPEFGLGTDSGRKPVRAKLSETAIIQREEAAIELQHFLYWYVARQQPQHRHMMLVLMDDESSYSLDRWARAGVTRALAQLGLESDYQQYMEVREALQECLNRWRTNHANIGYNRHQIARYEDGLRAAKTQLEEARAAVTQASSRAFELLGG
jgi:hypothetical protein